MANSLSRPHPDEPFKQPGVKLGDEQFAKDEEWRAAGRLALLGMGMDPGLTDVFAAHAAIHLFDRVDEIHIRDGGDLRIGGYAFAPVFSIWTTIEECLNPPVMGRPEGLMAHDRAIQRAGSVPLPGGHRTGGMRERRARGGAAVPSNTN